MNSILERLAVLFFLVPVMTFGMIDATDGAGSVQDVVFLSNEEYLPVLRESIREAKREIYIEMYLIRPGSSRSDPVTTIFSELSDARRRGVQVKVVLDRHFEKDNRRAAEHLKRAGVWDVEFESDETTDHTKLVLIDGEVMIIGSQNWTLSALAASNESAIFIKDKNVVDELRRKMARRKGSDGT